MRLLPDSDGACTRTQTRTPTRIQTRTRTRTIWELLRLRFELRALQELGVLRNGGQHQEAVREHLRPLLHRHRLELRALCQSWILCERGERPEGVQKHVSTVLKRFASFWVGMSKRGRSVLFLLGGQPRELLTHALASIKSRCREDNSASGVIFCGVEGVFLRNP